VSREPSCWSRMPSSIQGEGQQQVSQAVRQFSGSVAKHGHRSSELSEAWGALESLAVTKPLSQSLSLM